MHFSDDNYILVDGQPRIEPDLLAWAEWMQTHDEERIVKQTTVGDALVSTVFPGLNFAHVEGSVVLWETMVFGGVLDMGQWRYHCRAEAEAGHELAVEALKEQEAQVRKLIDGEKVKNA